jgi:hypothetical protein
VGPGEERPYTLGRAPSKWFAALRHWNRKIDPFTNVRSDAWHGEKRVRGRPTPEGRVTRVVRKTKPAEAGSLVQGVTAALIAVRVVTNPVAHYCLAVRLIYIGTVSDSIGSGRACGPVHICAVANPIHGRCARWTIQVTGVSYAVVS